DEYDIALSRAELRRRVEEHFRLVSASLPYYKRVKLLHFTEVELPRTATRKVKRREVLQMMETLEQSQKASRSSDGQATAAADTRWLLEVVASVSNRPRTEISTDTRLADLGFDSLMFVELATAIENAGGSISAPERFNEIQDVKELISVVGRGSAAASRAKRSVREQESEDDGEIYVPSLIKAVGNRGLDFVQKAFYERFLHTHYEGQTNIPAHTNFIVAANHSSHLDMGLTKMALGAAGKDMVALAAADYFFDNKYKRAYMENFTNLVPMERTGSLRQSLRHATSFLDRGYNALIFPEGTRSMTGVMADFKPVIGYLALASRVGILPIHLQGTYEAMPKGSNIIKSRDVGARIGRYLSIEQLEEMTKGMPRAEAYRLIAALVKHEVENLRDRTRVPFAAQEIRKRWKAERRALINDREAVTALNAD
ncbi:MAG: 1-acyl-sn-glycerol-3-phosphate acyltransferase, partial [Pyrinomonadaceae bacterium]